MRRPLAASGISPLEGPAARDLFPHSPSMFHRVAQVCVNASAVVVATTAAFGSDFAHQVISYIPGTGPVPGYTDPATALGAPERVTGYPFAPGVVSPFNPAYLPDEIVSIGVGGSLTLAFDPPLVDAPANPFGIDFIVFGNSFFVDLGYPTGVAGPIVSDGGVVEATADGVNWIAFPQGEPDGFLPTMAFVDAGPYDAAAGVMAANPHRPVDPAITPDSLIDATYQQLVTAYGGSAGGSGFDLAAVGLAHAIAIRITVPGDSATNVEVDAVARVLSASSGADINRDGAVDGFDLGQLLSAFGTADAASDVDGSGLVDASDLTAVLAAWSP